MGSAKRASCGACCSWRRCSSSCRRSRVNHSSPSATSTCRRPSRTCARSLPTWQTASSSSETSTPSADPRPIAKRSSPTSVHDRKDVASVYTFLPYTTYAAQLCVDLRGWTCPDAFSALFDGTVRSRTTCPEHRHHREGFRLDDVQAPSGWSAQDGEFTRTLKRTTPCPAPAVSRTRRGVSVSDVRYDATSVTFTVTRGAGGGGEVVFSRLAWPGLHRHGAELVRPDRGFLLTTSVDASAVGRR